MFPDDSDRRRRRRRGAVHTGSRSESARRRRSSTKDEARGISTEPMMSTKSNSSSQAAQILDDADSVSILPKLLQELADSVSIIPMLQEEFIPEREKAKYGDAALSLSFRDPVEEPLLTGAAWNDWDAVWNDWESDVPYIPYMNNGNKPNGNITPRLSEAIVAVENFGPSDPQGKADVIHLCNSVDHEQPPQRKRRVTDFLEVPTGGTSHQRKPRMYAENGTQKILKWYRDFYDGRQQRQRPENGTWIWSAPSPQMAILRFGMSGNDNYHNALVEVLMKPTAEAIDLPLSLFKRITGNFSDEQIIGRGGFGVVYKGVLQNDLKVAVKRLQAHIVDDARFHNEVNFMRKLKHKNVVRLLAYCVHTEKIQYTKDNGEKVDAEIRERLFCFEYVPHGTIQKHIADESRGLEWPKRYHIIKGICDGLAYIHNVRGIVHLDIKPDNILLHDNIGPKIADFGVSRLAFDYSKRTTKNKPGSLGYMAPEYMFYGKISRKADIFGLGRIIFELVTGSKGPESHEKNNFLQKVLTSWSKALSTSHSGDSFKLAINQVKTCIEIALNCTEDKRDNRPNIEDITQVLHT